MSPIRISTMLASALWLCASPAVAQTAPTSQPQPQPQPSTKPKPKPKPKAETGGDDDVDLGEIEKALGKDAKEAAKNQPAAKPVGPSAQSSNPDISFILDAAAAWFQPGNSLQFGGHDPAKRGFTLQQVEMGVQHAVDPYFRFDSFIVLLGSSIEVEEAYASTTSLPYNLKLRAGQFYTNFGRQNPTHPHTWDFVDAPFALTRLFGGDGNRNLGVEVSYLTPLPWYVEVLDSMTEARGDETARSFLGDADFQLKNPLLDLQNTLAVKQFFELSENVSLLWGLSFVTGPNAADKRTNIYATDLYLKYRPITHQSYTIVSLQTEWMYRRRRADMGLVQDLTGYAYLFYRFAQRWATAARYEYGTPPLDRNFDRTTDDLDPFWTGHRHRVEVNTTFWPSEFSRLRLQGGVDLPEWRDPIWSVMLALEVSVGAHAAHKF